MNSVKLGSANPAALQTRISEKTFAICTANNRHKRLCPKLLGSLCIGDRQLLALYRHVVEECGLGAPSSKKAESQCSDGSVRSQPGESSADFSTWVRVWEDEERKVGVPGLARKGKFGFGFTKPGVNHASPGQIPIHRST